MRLLALAALLVSTAHAAPRAFVVASVGDAPAHEGPIESRHGEPVHLYAVLQDGPRYFTSAPALRIGGRRIPAKRIAPLDAPVTWSLVEPRQHHVATPYPNFGNPAYSNSVLFGPRHGQWLGHDTLEYTQTPLHDAGPILTVTEARPLDAKLKRNKGLGTVRYAVAIDTPTGRVESPGAADVIRGGISPRVFRLSVRRGDDVRGWLTSLFNVPNVFGSAGQGKSHQAERHQGADCADVLIAGFRKAGHLPYTSVSGLYTHARVVSPRPPPLEPDGFYALTPEGKGEPVTLRFGADVQPGDVMVLDYGGRALTGRTWDHVGLIDADAGTGRPRSRPISCSTRATPGQAELAPISDHGYAMVQLLRMRTR
ncbi:MAG: hypothetical protein R3F43_25545 [bacterium]